MTPILDVLNCTFVVLSSFQCFSGQENITTALYNMCHQMCIYRCFNFAIDTNNSKSVKCSSECAWSFNCLFSLSDSWYHPLNNDKHIHIVLASAQSGNKGKQFPVTSFSLNNFVLTILATFHKYPVNQGIKTSVRHVTINP